MGLLDTAKAAVVGNRAYRLQVDGNKLAGDGKPREAREKFTQALKLYEEADRLGNNAPNILQAYALLLMREGEFERSKAMMQRLAKQKNLSKDDWFELRVRYAILSWRMGDVDGAIETIGRAGAYKMNGLVYSTLGTFWVDKARQTGDCTEALAFNQKAMDYDDEDAATLDNMGLLYEMMADAEGDPAVAKAHRDQALDYFERAHKIKPRQITTLYSLAKMYHENGDDAKARKLLSIRDKLYFSHICPVSQEMFEALAKEVG